MKTFIVKVQNSITTTGEKRQILIYNKDRSVINQSSVDAITKNFPLKSFWYAHIDERQYLVLDKPAPWQEW
jgi:hypothetical protein